MLRSTLLAALLLLLTSSLPAQQPAVPLPIPAPTDAQVDAAMQKAADYLLSQLNIDNWESPANPWPNPGDTGAQTALILHALLETGRNLQSNPVYHSKLFFRSKQLAPAVAWLTKNDPPNDYVAALQASAFALFTGNPRGLSPELDAIYNCRDTCLQKLIKARNPDGTLPLTTTAEVTLAAATLAERLEFPNAYWQATEKFWRNAQRKDGSFPDKLPGVGFRREVVGLEDLAALLAARSYNDNEIRLDPKPDPAVDLALHFLDTHPDLGTDPRYLLAVERVAQATGRKSFGNIRWFPEGVAILLHSQNPDGSWSGNLPTPVETAYALLFLAQGRIPVAFNKLQYEGHWNARPNDAAYLTHWLSRRLCDVPLQTQTVSLADPVETWLDAPVLFITGSQDPHFTPQDLAKLRAYVEAGGTIVSTADGSFGNFTNAMQKYALTITDQKIPFRPLPPDNELFDKNLTVDFPGHPPTLSGVNNGVRELWIHSPTDLGADWQMRKYANKNAFELGAALYFYANGISSRRSNLDPLTITPSPLKPTRTIHLARIDYPGNPNPEPGAWPRMAQLAQRDFKTDLQLHQTKIAELDPQKCPLAHLTGTGPVTFSPGNIHHLKTYLDNGGLLLIDTAGGDPLFANAAQTLIKSLYPAQKLQPLPLDHPIYTGAFPNGQKLDFETDLFRRFANIMAKKRIKTPDLAAIFLNDQPKILFTPSDLTSGLLGTNTWPILGYSPAAAQTLTRNILLYTAPAPAPNAP